MRSLPRSTARFFASSSARELLVALDRRRALADLDDVDLLVEIEHDAVQLAVLDRELARAPHDRGQLGRVLDQIGLRDHAEPRAHEHDRAADDRQDDHQLEHGHAREVRVARFDGAELTPTT